MAYRRPFPHNRERRRGSIGGCRTGCYQTVSGKVIPVIDVFELFNDDKEWRPAPAPLTVGSNLTDDEKKANITHALYETVEGILDKLNPQNCETLASHARSLPIDTIEKLQGVIDLIFKKAATEPNLSTACALLYREVSVMLIPADSHNSRGQEFLNPREVFVMRCQLEFKERFADNLKQLIKIQRIDYCADPGKKKRLQLELKELVCGMRIKNFGLTGFFGELFKQQLVSDRIIIKWLHNLMLSNDDACLECLCVLLTIVGKKLESNNIDLSDIFVKLKGIVSEETGRIGVMVQAVIDLQASHWAPLQN